MNALAAVRGIRIVLLDACRDDPFLATMQKSKATRSIGRGLAKIEPVSGTLVGYAAKEGTVAYDGNGRNSPYTAALLAHIEEPNLDIQFVFRRVRDSVMAATGDRQEPFTYGSLPGTEVVLAPSNDERAHSAPDATEIEYWTSVKNSKDRRALQSYIETYPRGAFVKIARLQLEQLDNEPLTSVDGLKVLTRRVQEALARVGCDLGKADGVWGDRSRKALRRFSESTGTDLEVEVPTQYALQELERQSGRVCAKAVETSVPKAQKPAVSSAPKPGVRRSTSSPPNTGTKSASSAKVCRSETFDECRVRARAAGARRHSGFCRNRLTICQ